MQAVILWGRTAAGDPQALADKIMRLEERDRERYLFDVPRHDIMLHGTSALDYSLQAVLDSPAVGRPVALVGPADLEEKLAHRASQPKRRDREASLGNEDVVYVPQGAGRISNVRLSWEALGRPHHHLLIIGGDAPLLQAEDISGMASYLSDGRTQRQDAILPLVSYQTARDYRPSERQYFWLKPYGLTKETGILLLDLSHLDISGLEQVAEGTKVRDIRGLWESFRTAQGYFWERSPTIGDYLGCQSLTGQFFAYALLRPLLGSAQPAGVAPTLQQLEHVLGMLTRPEQEDTTPARISMPLSRMRSAYRDMDSLEDALVLGLEIGVRLDPAYRVSSWGEASSAVQLDGVALIDRLGYSARGKEEVYARLTDSRGPPGRIIATAGQHNAAVRAS